jgi:flagellar biosynthesis/type III secretory pathway protein FliH
MPSSDQTPFAPLVETVAPASFRAFGESAGGAAVSSPSSDGRDAAYAAGEAAARGALALEQAALVQDVARAIEAIAAWREESKARFVPLLLEIALGTARAIVGDAAPARSEHWEGVLARAVAKLVECEGVVVRVGPRLSAALRTLPEPLAVHAADGVRVVEDSTLGPVACVVARDHPTAACDVDAQLVAARDALTALVEGR